MNFPADIRGSIILKANFPLVTQLYKLLSSISELCSLYFQNKVTNKFYQQTI
jgi:hypothetical protein